VHHPRQLQMLIKKEKQDVVKTMLESFKKVKGYVYFLP